MCFPISEAHHPCMKQKERQEYPEYLGKAMKGWCALNTVLQLHSFISCGGGAAGKRGNWDTLVAWFPAHPSCCVRSSTVGSLFQLWSWVELCYHKDKERQQCLKTLQPPGLCHRESTGRAWTSISTSKVAAKIHSNMLCFHFFAPSALQSTQFHSTAYAEQLRKRLVQQGLSPPSFHISTCVSSTTFLCSEMQALLCPSSSQSPILPLSALGYCWQNLCCYWI